MSKLFEGGGALVQAPFRSIEPAAVPNQQYRLFPHTPRPAKCILQSRELPLISIREIAALAPTTESGRTEEVLARFYSASAVGAVRVPAASKKTKRFRAGSGLGRTAALLQRVSENCRRLEAAGLQARQHRARGFRSHAVHCSTPHRGAAHPRVHSRNSCGR